MATAFKAYWDRLKTDTETGGGHGKQAVPLRTADGDGPISLTLEDGSADVDIWFSPNTPRARPTQHQNEARPPDLDEVFKLIAGAKQAILFVVFEPGEPSIIDAVGAAQKANPALFVRGTVTVSKAAEDFAIAIKGDAPGSGSRKTSDSVQMVPADYRVIPATGIKDPISVWEKELNSAGFAITHSKYVVIDPFSDSCVVVTGSHNLGDQASYNNDENMVIIRGHRPIAEAYAANALDIYDHYAWRWWLAKDPQNTWTSLKPDDSWQNSYFDDNSSPIAAGAQFLVGGLSIGRRSPELQCRVAGPARDRHKKSFCSPERRAPLRLRRLADQATAREHRLARHWADEGVTGSMGEQTLFLIRHAEKPEDGQPGGVAMDGTADRRSLAPKGWQRAGCWPSCSRRLSGGKPFFLCRRRSSLLRPEVLMTLPPPRSAAKAVGPWKPCRPLQRS